MEIYLENSDGDQICFNHAVKAVIENNEHIRIKAQGTEDLGQSGAWWLGGCKKCEEEREEKND